MARKSGLVNKWEKQKREYASKMNLAAIDAAAKRAVSEREEEELLEARREAMEKLGINENSIIIWVSGTKSEIIKILPDLLIRIDNWDEIDPCSLLKLRNIQIE